MKDTNNSESILFFIKNLIFFHIATQFMNIFYLIGYINIPSSELQSSDTSIFISKILYALGFLVTIIAFYFVYQAAKVWFDLKIKIMSTMLGAFFVVLSSIFRILPLLWIFGEIFVFQVFFYISILSNVFYGLCSISIYYSDNIPDSMKKSFVMLGILHILLVLVFPFLVIASIVDIIVLYKLLTNSGGNIF